MCHGPRVTIWSQSFLLKKYQNWFRFKKSDIGTITTYECNSTQSSKSSYVKLMSFYRSYRFSRPKSAQSKLFLTNKMDMTRSILQECMLYVCTSCTDICSKYEALFLFVKFVTLPPPLHPRALLSAPLGQPTAKLKVYKLPTTSKKSNQCNSTKK